MTTSEVVMSEEREGLDGALSLSPMSSRAKCTRSASIIFSMALFISASWEPKCLSKRRGGREEGKDRGRDI